MNTQSTFGNNKGNFSIFYIYLFLYFCMFTFKYLFICYCISASTYFQMYDLRNVLHIRQNSVLTHKRRNVRSLGCCKLRAHSSSSKQRHLTER